MRNGMMSENSEHLCANYRAYSYDDGFFEYVRISRVQFAHILSIVNVIISR